MYDWFDLIVVSLREHPREYVTVWLGLTGCYVLAIGAFYYRWLGLRTCQPKGNTAVHQKPAVFTSRATLKHFRVYHPQLTRNNAVYLAEFECDRYWVGVVVHFLYGLVLYFADPINLFCLLISMGQVYEYCNVKALDMCVRSSVPLAAFAVVSASMYTYSVSRLLQKQMQMNNAPCLARTRWVGPTVSIAQSQLKRGNLVRLGRDSVASADLLLLTSSPCVLVDELELTGEAVLTSKSTVSVSTKPVDDENPAAGYANDELVVHHFQDQGRLGRHAYSAKNMVFAGTRVVDGEAWAVVLETGNDCQIYRINRSLRRKITRVQQKVTRVCLLNLYLMLFIALFTSLVIYYKSEHETHILTWRQLWPVLRKMILLFNTMIPLSLQLFFERASSTLSSRIARDLDVCVNRNGSMAFQSDPVHIVSDKTGTMTTNRTELRNVLAWDENASDVVCLFRALDTHPHHMLLDSPLTDAAARGVLSCTGIAIASDGTMLNNDVLEYHLIQSLVVARQWKLLHNSDQRIAWRTNCLLQCSIQRLLYCPYDHAIEVKFAITVEDEKATQSEWLVLHAQGTPEALLRYACARGKTHLEQMLRSTATTVPSDAYRKQIAYGSRRVTRQELEQVVSKTDGWTRMLFCELDHVHLYTFHDFLVPGIDKAIADVTSDGRRDFSMLTGDKMESALETARAAGLLGARTFDYDYAGDVQHLHSADDLVRLALSSSSKNTKALLINGRIIEQVLSGEEALLFAQLLKNAQVKVIYRASPHCKQMYVAFLQTHGMGATLMIGDGCNDIAALMQADVGIGISGGESTRASGVSEIAINNWTQLPDLLRDFGEKSLLVLNVARWVLMKHMMTAFTLLAMLLISAFERMQDPAHPLTMLLFNATMFGVMGTYCHTETLPSSATLPSFRQLVIKGACLGLLDGMLVFAAAVDSEVNASINALIALHALQLLLQMRQLKYQRQWNRICNVVHLLIASAWSAWLLLNLTNIAYGLPIGGLVCAFSWLVFSGRGTAP